MKALLTFIVALIAYFIPYAVLTAGTVNKTDFNTGFICVLLIIIAMILNKK
jgi:hypothetical protein